MKTILQDRQNANKTQNDNAMKSLQRGVIGERKY
jgi:hypothetical protein